MSSFSVQHRRDSNIDILDLHGELDAHTASQLEDALTELIDQNQIRIVIDCKSLQYIASAGLGVFMAYIEEVRSMGGDIKLISMQPRVYNVFDLLGFPTLYDILDSFEDALEKFTADSES